MNNLLNEKSVAIVFLALILTLHTMSASAQTLRFTLLHTSDEHSVLTPLPAVDYHPEKANPSLGGFARLSGFVNQVREQKADEPVLLLSSGDFIGGSPYAWLILEGYSPEIELMKEIGYDAATIGNHEFDYGPDKLARYLIRSGYPSAHKNLPLLAANLNIPDGHSLHEVGLLPNTILELSNGLKIGLFGLLGTDAYAVATYAEPVSIIEPIEVARQQALALQEKGADIIIALSHSGVREDREIAAALDNVHIILGGHDHFQNQEPELINQTLLMHSSYYLQYVGMMELEFDTQTGNLKLLNKANNNPFQIALDDSIEENPAIRERVDEYTQKLNNFVYDFSEGLFTDVNAQIMQSDFPLVKERDFVETTVGNFVVDAMRLETEKLLNQRVDIAIQANGVIRGNIIPGTQPWSEGKVSFMDLVTIAGLGSGPDEKAGYPMVSVYITAQEVYNMLEVAGLLSTLMGDMYFLQMSGLQYTFDPGKITWLTIPFANIPVPAYRSVRDVNLFTGQGIQHEGGYEPLEQDAPGLFHLVSDYYLTSFLPMIGDILPRLKIVLKDSEGQPLELENTIIIENGKEFKVWEAVARYAVSFTKEPDGLPQMPEAYRDTQNRIVEEKGIPLKMWAWPAIVLLLGGVGFGIYALIRRLRKKNRR